jgi:uncharacterized protein YgiB involved in biofilm formation
MSDLKQQIDQERNQAREVCSIEGTESQDCAAAWDAVEELQAEASHKQEEESPKTAFEQYCDDNPEAAECRVYED